MHGEVSIAIFGETKDEDEKRENRVKAKTINFGIMYGLTPPKLAEDLNISVSEAEFMINAWYERMPKG